MVDSPNPVRLRPLCADDEPAFRAAHDEMGAEGFTFGLGYDSTGPFADYVDRLERYSRGVGLPEGWVPSTFLVADVDGAVVGRSSIRHELNDFLAREGGHIGHGVLAGHRRRGYAIEILRQSLVIARAQGVERVLVTCDDTNEGSAAVIERCGGDLESTIVAEDGHRLRRYWIG